MTVFTESSNIVNTLSDSVKDSIAAKVSSRWKMATEEITNLIEESREGWDFYLRNVPQAQHKSGNKSSKDAETSADKTKGLRLGLIPRSIDSVLAILHSSIFPSDEKFFRGTPKNDVAQEYQELAEQFLTDNMAEANTVEAFRRYLLTLCVDPAACCAVQWKKKTRKKVVYETPTFTVGNIEIPVPLLGLKKKTINDFVEWEGTDVDPLTFNDWRVDPWARNMDESWFARRWYEPVWKVKKEYNLKEVKPYHNVNEEDLDLNNQRRSGGLVNPIPFQDEEDGKENALMMVMYDDWVEDGVVYENHVALILNGKDTIWFGPNPYNHGRIPYIVHSLNPIPNQIYGLSLIKHAVPSAAVVDTIVTKTLKVADIAASPIFEVDMHEPVFKKNQAVKTGKTYPTRRPNAIRQIPVNVSNLSFLDSIKTLCEDNIRELTGASPVFTGEDFNNSPSNITAFQVDQHIQGGHVRFEAQGTNFKNNVLEPMLFMTFENHKQYKSKDEYVRVGIEEHELTVDMLRQMDFKWITTSAQASQAKGKRLANLKSLLMEIAPAAVQAGIMTFAPKQVILNQDVALKDLLVLGGMPNADELMTIIDMGAQNGLQGVPGLDPGAGGAIPQAPVQPQGMEGAMPPAAGAGPA